MKNYTMTECEIGQFRYSSTSQGNNFIHAIDIVVDYNSYISTQNLENHDSNTALQALSCLLLQVTKV